MMILSWGYLSTVEVSMTTGISEGGHYTYSTCPQSLASYDTDSCRRVQLVWIMWAKQHTIDISPLFPLKIATDVKLHNDQIVYSTNHSPMCAYMVKFIKRLKCLPVRYLINIVLENFTVLQVCGDLGECEFELSCNNSVSSKFKFSILSWSPSILLSPSSSPSLHSFLLYVYLLPLSQVVSDYSTHETLLCIAYVFEVCKDDSVLKHHIYRLVKDSWETSMHSTCNFSWLTLYYRYCDAVVMVYIMCFQLMISRFCSVDSYSLHSLIFGLQYTSSDYLAFVSTFLIIMDSLSFCQYILQDVWHCTRYCMSARKIRQLLVWTGLIKSPCINLKPSFFASS